MDPVKTRNYRRHGVTGFLTCSFMLFKDRNEKIIFLLAIIWHEVLFLLIYFKLGWGGFFWGDAEGYIQIAKNLLGGNGFSMAFTDPFIPDGLRTPMFPVFLAGVLFIFKNLYFVSLIHILLFAFSSLMLYRLAKEFVGNKAALIGLLFFILEPATAYWNVMWLTETLFLFLFILGLHFFIKFYRNNSILDIFFSASFLGFATLTRPAAQGLWFIFLVITLFLFKKIGIKRYLISLLIFIITFGVVISPWLIRNKIYFNTYGLSSADTSVFFHFNLKSYLKINKLENVDIEPDYLFGLTKKTLISVDLSNDLNSRPYFIKKWFNLVLADPVGYSKVHIFSLIPYFVGDGYTELARQIFPNLYRPSNINWNGTLSGIKSFVFDHRGIEAVIFWGGKMFWSLIYFFAILGTIDLLRRRQYFYLALFLGIIFYFALTIGAVAYSRYRFPINPFIFLLTACGIEKIIFYLKNHLKTCLNLIG